MSKEKELNNINSRLKALDDTLGTISVDCSVTLGEVVMLLHEVINRQSDLENFLWKDYYRMEDKNGK
jgi:hypothetical protein